MSSDFLPTDGGCQVVMDCHAEVSLQQLTDSVHVFGHDYVSNRQPQQPGLLYGQMQVWELEDGLLLYRTQVVDRCDIRTSNALRPSLKLLLLLDGCIDVSYGRQWQHLDASQQPCALLVNLAREDGFMRQWKTGRPERKLLISCSPQWLQAKGLLQAVPQLNDHLAQRRWQPSRKAIALAEQLHYEAHPGAVCNSLHKLAWQARVLELLHEGLAQLAIDQRPGVAPALADSSAAVSLSGHQRLCGLREWLASSAGDGLGMAEIAQSAGMSVSYLQRHFPQVANGLSVAGFLRIQRLQRARRALEEQGVSVAAAAEVAGYASATHFAKAFRQVYGCAPSQWGAGG